MASESGHETFGHTARILTSEEIEKLQNDTQLVTDFKQNKFEKEAQKNWDLFYKRNTTKFFKDRHWTTREFKELLNDSTKNDQLVIFEVGCGVGNFMFPLLQEDPSLYFYSCDFSQRAVDFVKENELYNKDRSTVFQCDITQDNINGTVNYNSIDVATLIFVLSAIHPDKMVQALHKIYQVIKPGGCLLIRDYGLYDFAMLRFSKGHKLAENFYVRQDGTRAFYFSTEYLEEKMTSAGFIRERNDYVERNTVNKKEGINVPRIFVQGKFVKPHEKS
ncbi:hypothetical protein LOTGIDRAFT_223580 [Lottia gigantea]|uniref:tRNA N(3)-methylcytidine methyltransferase n=1 Tax=Lottia gigantea TaxID=225164 RepID=V3ZMN2_LOTGI|nr:hypothetical protein LOTGIDRAFT_223580 [Lottia gigantea]ESO82096.1 hypothetical protein LOTGIDRAFT_223580 [Lottia gigantea]